MPSLWKRIFESDEDRMARQRAEVQAERSKQASPPAKTRMKVAPPQQAPNLGGAIGALKRRKKYLSGI